MQPKPLHILISPLDWGLGHASRCIPLIRHLIKSGQTVTLAGAGRSLHMLQLEFPNLKSIEIPGFSPTYSGSGNTLLHLFLLLPAFLKSLFSEHRSLQKILETENPDIVISDNRYGFRHKSVKSILLTHQVMVKTPAWLKFAEYPLYRISRMLISRFDECWVPDHEQKPGLSGDLSHKYRLPGNARFIGPLSRFENRDTSGNAFSVDRKIIAIISGPEPQRSIFEKIIYCQLREMNVPALIVGGKPEMASSAQPGSTPGVLPYLATEQLGDAILSASLVICRSGYSSVMDLQALGAKALFVPTPGQTEQEYLAAFFMNEGIALSRAQDKLNLANDLAEAFKSTGFEKRTTAEKYKTVLDALRKK